MCWICIGVFLEGKHAVTSRIGKYLQEEFDVEALRNHETQEVEKLGKFGTDFG